MKTIKGTFGTGAAAIFDNINGEWRLAVAVHDESRFEATESDVKWAKRIAEQHIHEYEVNEIELS